MGDFKCDKQMGRGQLFVGGGGDAGVWTLAYEGGFRNNKKHGYGR